MLVFPIGIEHRLHVTVQGAHDADPCEHCRAAFLGHEDQGFHRGQP
jgi:hypothetical protein